MFLFFFSSLSLNSFTVHWKITFHTGAISAEFLHFYFFWDKKFCLYHSFLYASQKWSETKSYCHIAFCFSLAESAAYTGRVRFATSDPIADSALILMGTRSSDEGKYTCKIATFPTGNFQTEMLVTVWSEYINHGFMGKQKTANFCHTVTVHILYISTVEDHHKPLLIFSLLSGRECIWF